ncbi:hypothetical protein TorRG33x02_125830 [Trema orientale]|uniref:Uncharacterized protein n=1 Tax=Trema orientale TaxID=63057 RepID=A0A2P5F175_TREOI|nr:hypothetical protein TorRG33x02_125830 [Trema orientale]
MNQNAVNKRRRFATIGIHSPDDSNSFINPPCLTKNINHNTVSHNIRTNTNINHFPKNPSCFGQIGFFPPPIN